MSDLDLKKRDEKMKTRNTPAERLNFCIKMAQQVLYKTTFKFYKY